MTTKRAFNRKMATAWQYCPRCAKTSKHDVGKPRNNRKTMTTTKTYTCAACGHRVTYQIVKEM